MTQTTLRHTKILGHGSYLPENKVTNYDLEKLMDTSHDWIVERTGIHQRCFAVEGQHTSDLALEASKIALQRANLSPDDIDLILLGTASADKLLPTASCILQTKLGTRKIPCLDISAACSGFVYGLTIADQFIKTGMYQRILVIGAEHLHHLIDYEDRATAVLFGDGAGAFVVGPAEDNEPSKIYSSHLWADGELGDVFVVPGGGSELPLSPEVIQNKQHLLKMKGKEIFKIAVKFMSQSSKQLLQKHGYTIEDIDCLVPHQANLRILEGVAKQLSLPLEKIAINISEMGNTSAATVPCAFDYATKNGQIKRGDLVLLTAFGAGITGGSVLLRY